MKYTIGPSPIYTRNGVAMPGDTIDASDLQDGTNVLALIAGGHLTGVKGSDTPKQVER